MLNIFCDFSIFVDVNEQKRKSSKENVREKAFVFCEFIN